MHIIDNINLKRIFIATGIYTVIYLGFWNSTNTTIGNYSSVVFTAFYLFIFLVLVVSGFIAGRLAKSSGWSNGIIVGITVPVINAIVNDIFPGIELIYIPPVEIFINQLIPATVCCCIGGYIADLLRKTN